MGMHTHAHTTCTHMHTLVETCARPFVNTPEHTCTHMWTQWCSCAQCVQVHTESRAHAHRHTPICEHTLMHTGRHAHADIHRNMCTSTRVCTHTCERTGAHACTDAHTQSHTGTHMHVHTHLQKHRARTHHSEQGEGGRAPGGGGSPGQWTAALLPAASGTCVVGPPLLSQRLEGANPAPIAGNLVLL